VLAAIERGDDLAGLGPQQAGNLADQWHVDIEIMPVKGLRVIGVGVRERAARQGPTGVMDNPAARCRLGGSRKPSSDPAGRSLAERRGFASRVV
jgi:hypothetical protein